MLRRPRRGRADFRVNHSPFAKDASLAHFGDYLIALQNLIVSLDHHIKTVAKVAFPNDLLCKSPDFNLRALKANIM